MARINKEFFKNKKKAIIIISLLVVGFLLTNVLFAPKKKNDLSKFQKTAKVTRGNIKTVILGTGSIQSENTNTLISQVAGTVKSVFFKNGAKVKKGMVIVEIDSKIQRDKIDSIERQIKDLQISLQDVNDQLDSLVVKAPFSGYISNLTVKVNDVVTGSFGLLTINDDSYLKVMLKFPSSCYGIVKLGQKVVVNIPSISQSIEGYISYIGNRLYAGEFGGEVLDIGITVKNTGGLNEGMKANAQITIEGQVIKSVDENTFEYINKQIVKSPINAEVKSIYINQNQYVEKGQTLLVLSNNDLEKQKKQLEIKMEDLQSQLKSAKEELQKYVITAPIDGIISDMNIKENDTITIGQPICTLFDNNNLVFTVNIDELDITNIKIGQKVDIKVDALPETSKKPISGMVKEISEKGNTQGSVTTYPVVISFKNNSNIKIGMNADAEIIINEKNDVLILPIEAVQKKDNKYYVYLKENKPSSEKNKSSASKKDSNAKDEFGVSMSYYKGSTEKEVKVGINDDKNIEILSGLKEGDVVVLPQFDTSITNPDSQSNGFIMQ